MFVILILVIDYTFFWQSNNLILCPKLFFFFFVWHGGGRKEGYGCISRLTEALTIYSEKHLLNQLAFIFKTGKYNYHKFGPPHL